MLCRGSSRRPQTMWCQARVLIKYVNICFGDLAYDGKVVVSYAAGTEFEPQSHYHILRKVNYVRNTFVC
ncbi:hypothetical protein VPHD480_0380 [Vibrio phage D480]|nr:hypothetical protein MYOV011v1_p0248 [Vibrio phage 6E35.1a]